MEDNNFHQEKYEEKIKMSNFFNYTLNIEQEKQLKSINFEKNILPVLSKIDINENFFSIEYNKINYEDSVFKENNYILTPEIKIKLSQLYTYIKNQIPCILEGETGSSKTFSTLILTKYLAKNWEKEGLHKDFRVLRFNLSSESKASDLLGKYIGDKESFAGIVFKPGLFIKAFTEGHCLLLDEINLASPPILQCIEEALDRKLLSIEMPGMPLKTFKMHENFCLVATQNPNKGNFARKRNELKPQFLSRFQIISFDEFTEKELIQICNGMVSKEDSEKYKDIIANLISFHIKLNKKPEIKRDIINYTIREISLFMQALTDKNNNLSPYELILVIYGSKYPIKKLSLIEDLLKECKISPEINKIENEINQINLEDIKDKEIETNFKNCFVNPSLKRACKAINFAINYGKNVIILGKPGVGKTQLSIWLF